MIGVTGSNGKSTTAALIHHLLQTPNHVAADDKNGNVFLGGNIGKSLLSNVTDMTCDDTVVLELSSFQLHHLQASQFAPAVAVITNLSPNHLNWHGSFDHYRSAKQVLLNRQKPDAIAVVPADHEVNVPAVAGDDAAIPTWRVRGRCFRFGLNDGGENGVFAENGSLIFRSDKQEDAVRLQPPSSLPGAHNLKNIAAATCVAWTMNIAPDEIVDRLASFCSLPHRLQVVASDHRATFYNDSVATTPESAIAALQTCRPPLVIIAGGANKGADLSEFAEAIAHNACSAVLIGETAPVLREMLKQVSDVTDGFTAHIADDFATAFSQAVALVPPGGIVLLSPGCASYGWFRDFRARGEMFTKLAYDWIASQ